MWTQAATWADQLATLGLDPAGFEVDGRGTIRTAATTHTETGSPLPKLTLADDAEDAGADYALGGTLGQGGMGLVRLAQQRSLHRSVAVKQVRPDRDGSLAREWLLREARVTGALEHPNIVPVHFLGLDVVGRPAFVMKHIEGREWAQLLAEPDPEWVGDDPLAFHLRVLDEVCRAVHYAHSKSVVHRDIKPDNVLIGRFGEVYLVDWGIAVGLEGAEEHLPRAPETEVVGSPGYLAPEMAAGQSSALSPATDVYLLGACLYEVLAGHPPHQGASLAEKLEHAFRGELPAVPAHVPEPLAQVCLRALARLPEERFADVEAFRLALLQVSERSHALGLLAQAEARIEALGERLHTDAWAEHADAVTEARFALRMAEEGWPGLEALAEAHRHLARVLVEAALARGDVAAARRELRHFPELAGAFAEALEAAEAQVAAQREDAAAMARERFDQDPRRGSVRRFGLMVFVIGWWWMLTGIPAYLHETRGIEPSWWAFLSVLLSAAVIVALSTEVLVHQAMNRADRMIFRTIQLNLLLVSVMAVCLWLVGAEPSMVLPIVAVVVAGPIAQLANFMDRRVWGAVGIALVAGVIAATFFEHVWLLTCVLGSVYVFAMTLYEGINAAGELHESS